MTSTKTCDTCPRRHVGCHIDCRDPAYLAEIKELDGWIPFNAWQVISGYRYDQCERNRRNALLKQQAKRRTR